MNLAALDKRLEENIKTLEKSLDKYDKLLKEASELKSVYETNIASGGATMQQFFYDISAMKEECSLTVARAKKNYEKASKLLKELEQKKVDFDQYIVRVNEMLNNKLISFHQRNEENLHNLDIKIKVKISQMEESNKVEFLRILNNLSVQEQEIITSKNELTGFITNEVKQLLEKNMLMDKQITALNERLQAQKRDNELEFINERSRVEKELGEWSEKNNFDHQEIISGLNETIMANNGKIEEQFKSINKKFHYFTGVAGILFVVIFIISLRG